MHLPFSFGKKHNRPLPTALWAVSGCCVNPCQSAVEPFFLASTASWPGPCIKGRCRRKQRVPEAASGGPVSSPSPAVVTKNRGGDELAIQLVISSNTVPERYPKSQCKRRHAAGKSRRNQLCSTGGQRTTQSRGPSHDWGGSNDMVVKLLPLVKRVALNLRGHLPAHVELDDLISDGTVGLIDAVRKFDPARGVTLESYARYRIRGAILDSLRDQDHASRDMRRRMKKIESTCQGLEHRLGRPAEDAEMAAAMGLSLKQWYQRVAELQRIGFEGTASRIPQEYNRRINEENLPAAEAGNPY